MSLAHKGPELRTSRLLLRRWRDTDLDAFVELNADPEVMRYFGSTLSREESDQAVKNMERQFDDRGFGLWAVELAGKVPLIGYVGLYVPRFQAHFTPAVEVGWRLARAFWGNGYATEGAQAALAFAFQHHRVPEIVSFTASTNRRSIAVMKRLGMSGNPIDDFDYPGRSEDNPLRRQVLYRLRRDQWQQAAKNDEAR